MRNALPIVFFGVFCLLLGLGLQRSLSGARESLVLVDLPSPDFDVVAMENELRPVFGVENMANGEVKIVQFFASWCPPCRAEHPILMGLAETHNIAIYGIIYRDDALRVAGYLADEGNPYTRLAMDNGGRAALAWGVSGTPESFIVDGEGRIRFHIGGAMRPSMVERYILPIIEQVQNDGEGL